MKLFGTDGIRGIANEELTADLAFKVGYATAIVIRKEIAKNSKVIIGRDTRISGSMLEAALIAGLCAAGANVYTVGVMPTPAVAYLTRIYKADAGIVISASHNPFEFNGIKIFSHRGYKLHDELEAEIEELVENYDSLRHTSSTNIGKHEHLPDAEEDYLRHLEEDLSLDLRGYKIALDCANGANYKVAPELFKRCGAELVSIGVEPNGFNINDNCGSTAPEDLRKLTKLAKCDIGLAFDGDADRLLACTSEGELVDGDGIMMILARYLKSTNSLLNNGLVATVMSNFGLDEFLEKADIKLVKTDVGDRQVLERMLADGYVLGGEQSGHIILLEHTTTGDGLLSAIWLIKALQEAGQSLAEAAEDWTIYPQVLINVRVPNEQKARVMQDQDLIEQIAEFTEQLAGRGRILVRPSGTEPKLRIMLEGKDEGEIARMGEFLANLISARYGI